MIIGYSIKAHYYAAVLTGRITCLARQSVRLSVRPVRALNLNNKRRSKTKMGMDVLQSRSNRCVPILSSKHQRSSERPHNMSVLWRLS